MRALDAVLKHERSNHEIASILIHERLRARKSFVAIHRSTDVLTNDRILHLVAT